MKRRFLLLAIGFGAFVLSVGGCSWFSSQTGSPVLQPLIAAAPEGEPVTLQKPLPVGLVWLWPSEGSLTLPKRSETATVESIRSHFAKEGKGIHVVSVDRSASVDLPALRRLGQAHGLTHFLLVAPTVQEVELPARLRYGRGGYDVGTRTESFVLLEAVTVEVPTGKSLFAARGNGAAVMEALDYGALGPWYPRIARGVGPAGSGELIFPDGEEFQPHEVRAVALKDALAGLLAELDQVGNLKGS